MSRLGKVRVFLQVAFEGFALGLLPYALAREGRCSKELDLSKHGIQLFWQVKV